MVQYSLTNLIVTEIYSKILFCRSDAVHSKITRHDIYLRTCIFTVYIYLSIHILIYLSMSVSVVLEITKLYSITVCERSVSWRSLVLP